MAELVLLRKSVLEPYITIRPFDKPAYAYQHDLVNLGFVERLRVGARFRTLGLVYDVHEHRDRNGRTMAFASILDDESWLSVTIFASLYDLTIKNGDKLHLVGRVQLYDKVSYRLPEITRIVTDYEVLSM